jgi:hypothetical protein
MKPNLLVVLQTHSLGDSQRPDGDRFCKTNKCEVMRRCSRSLVESINYAKDLLSYFDFELVIMDDHSDESSIKHLKNNLNISKFPTKLIHLESRGIMPSILACYEYGKNHGSDWVYFAQDDYLYEETAIYDMLMTAFFTSQSLQNYTCIFPFNDPYRYIPVNTAIQSHIIRSQNRHWRTQNATCSCFMVHHQVILKNWDLFYKMGTHQVSKDMEDNSINQLFQFRGYYLFVPIPSLALHIQYEAEYDPLIDYKVLWDKYDTDTTINNHTSKMKYSIVIPHLSTSKYIDECIRYIKQNSLYENEIITIVDETDVYYAFNKGVYQANCETVVLMNDDMIVSKHWDKHIPLYSKQDTILTGYVVEPNPGKMMSDIECLKYDCGTDIDSFDFDKFQSFVKTNNVPEISYDKKGWFQPLVVNQKSFVTYPNILKFPEYANDVTLIEDILPKLNYKFAQIDMFVYHFQRQATKHSNILKKRAIFTYCNPDVDKKISHLQSKVIEKFNTIPNCKYEFLMYNAKDGDMVPNQVIDYGLNELFFNQNYETILILDIDCIPLSSYAIDYIFSQAESGKIVGNIQRSNHLDNNKHVYVAPSCICITREMFMKLGNPSFNITNRSDIGEELCYIAEDNNVELEMFMPSKYEKLPYGDDKPWDLKDDMPKYGIGTTFVNNEGQEMFYHLFQSRLNYFSDLFFIKCATILL